MCGIYGVVDLHHRTIAPSQLKAATDTLTHRGPDDAGYALINSKSKTIRLFSDRDSPEEVRSAIPVLHEQPDSIQADIGLGHRRFAIIDLSPGGHQPFTDSMMAKRL